MDKTKEAVSSFLKKSGHHDTTVHETVAPAVTKEVVSPTRHEHVTTAIDKEIHQDHHHTSIQPVHHKEVLPEQHTHQQAAVETRHFEHGDAKDVERRRLEEAARFKDERTVGSTTHTQSTEPTVAGEHIHHHVHETIQPVVQKETIQPHVVHTTVPVHEVHNNPAQHHATSALPAVSMADFKKQGGVLGGREERHDGFEGEPKALQGLSSSGTAGHTSTTGTTGTTGTAGTAGHTSTTGTTGTTGHTSTTGTTGHTSSSGYTEHTSSGTTRDLTGTTASTDSATGKPSLLDKINPKVDASGDGKPGFMK